jgi:hypothetical protein
MACGASKPNLVVESLVPARKLVMPWGGTGEGKTYFIAELGTAIAMRRKAFGQFEVRLPHPPTWSIREIPI